MRVSHGLYKSMIDEAESAAPFEAVGLVYGESNHADRLVPLHNKSSIPTRFALDEEEVDGAILKEGAAPLGFFHSHPTDIASPSAADIEGAKSWPRALHFILSMRENNRLACWMIFDGQALREPLEFESE